MRRWPGKESPGLTQLVVRRNGLVGTRGAGDDQRDRDRHSHNTTIQLKEIRINSECLVAVLHSALRSIFDREKKSKFLG